MRLTLAAALFGLACGAAPAQSEGAAASAPGEADRCRGLPDAIAGAIGRAVEEELDAKESQEEASFALLELLPDRPPGQRVVDEALRERGLSREDLGRCLAQDESARPAFEQRLRAELERARRRARALPTLSATHDGCQRLLPLMVSAKEHQRLPLALGAQLVLPCAGKVSERELRCAIAEATVPNFDACRRGERDPPPPSR